jgi:hypothetical protein
VGALLSTTASLCDGVTRRVEPVGQNAVRADIFSGAFLEKPRVSMPW